MCDYKIMDIPIYSDMIRWSKTVVDEFLLKKFDKRNKIVRKNVDKYPEVKCFGLCGRNTVVVEPSVYDNLVKTASNILDWNGFKTKLQLDDDDEDENVSVEIIYIDSDGRSIEPDFGIHCDNDAYQYKKVHTLVLYYHIDCDGGELEIYNNLGLFRGYKLEDTIQTNTSNIATRRIVMMSGNTYHCPTKVYNGKRIAFVYNIKAMN